MTKKDYEIIRGPVIFPNMGQLSERLGFDVTLKGRDVTQIAKFGKYDAIYARRHFDDPNVPLVWIGRQPLYDDFKANDDFASRHNVKRAFREVKIEYSGHETLSNRLGLNKLTSKERSEFHDGMLVTKEKDGFRYAFNLWPSRLSPRKTIIRLSPLGFRDCFVIDQEAISKTISRANDISRLIS